jgi:hypothetical protein
MVLEHQAEVLAPLESWQVAAVVLVPPQTSRLQTWVQRRPSLSERAVLRQIPQRAVKAEILRSEAI